MTQTTEIAWADYTWNPIRGCSRVSEGCRNCYAEGIARRFSGPGQAFEGFAERKAGSAWTGRVDLIPEKLAEPLSWRKPKGRVFVNSMSDLFHEKLSNEDVAAVFGVMAAVPGTTFLVLTKRAHRMAAWFRWLRDAAEDNAASVGETPTSPIECAALAMCLPESIGDNVRWCRTFRSEWPLPNVWLGVSCEDQKTADERIPHLLQCPATVRWVSAEPLLGPIDFREVACPDGDGLGLALFNHGEDAGLDWVVVGGESGHTARPCNVEWIRFIRDQCKTAGTAFFSKQLGTIWAKSCANHRQIGRHSAKRVDIHGADPSEWPEDLRVREYPL